MKQNKAFKFRIYPNEEQKILFAKTFGCVRFIYNKMLEDKIEYYNKYKQRLNNTPSQYKGKFEWLKEVDSMALSYAQMNLHRAFSNFFNNPKSGFPNFKNKHKSKKSYTTRNKNNLITLKDGYLRLPKTPKLVKIKQHRQIPKDYIIKSVTISQDRIGRYYASILCEYDTQIEPVKPESFLGLKFSINNLFTASNGYNIEYLKLLESIESILKKIKQERKAFHRCLPNSKNQIKKFLQIGKLYEKLINKRKDFLHKLSRQIANAYDCVCIEDLDMKAMKSKLKLKKYVAYNGWGMFTVFLKYKLEDLGKQLIKIDECFPSSKICSNCGSTKRKLKLGSNKYRCNSCGIVLDKDYNASINIKNQGMKLVIS